MKIIYLSDSILPSKTANSVHVMNMCHSLAKLGHQLTFLAISSESLAIKGINDLFDFYGVDKNFKLKILPIKNIKNRILNVFYRELFINSWLKKEINKIKPDFVYGRQVVGCYLSAKKGYLTAFEAHAPMWEIGPVVHFYFKKLLKQKQFCGFTSISKALIRIYEERGFSLPKTILLPDASVEVADFFKKPILP